MDTVVAVVMQGTKWPSRAAMLEGHESCQGKTICPSPRYQREGSQSPSVHPRDTREKALRVHLSIPEIPERRLSESICPSPRYKREGSQSPSVHPRGTREKALRVHLSIPEIQERRLSESICPSPRHKREGSQSPSVHPRGTREKALRVRLSIPEIPERRLSESICPSPRYQREGSQSPSVHPRDTREKALRVHLSIPETQERRLSESICPSLRHKREGSQSSPVQVFSDPLQGSEVPEVPASRSVFFSPADQHRLSHRHPPDRTAPFFHVSSPSVESGRANERTSVMTASSFPSAGRSAALSGGTSLSPAGIFCKVRAGKQGVWFQMTEHKRLLKDGPGGVDTPGR
ncbi:unnamed protein product [Arctogadus glacialis]